MTSAIADGVMAATHKLVQQAMTGQWQDVPRTVEQRRELLHQLTASATPQDQHWLGALQQAMAESDAVVSKLASASAPAQAAPVVAPATSASDSNGAIDTVDSTMDLIRGSR